MIAVQGVGIRDLRGQLNGGWKEGCGGGRSWMGGREVVDRRQIVDGRSNGRNLRNSHLERWTVELRFCVRESWLTKEQSQP
jgi:hypothetical protein